MDLLTVSPERKLRDQRRNRNLLAPIRKPDSSLSESRSGKRAKPSDNPHIRGWEEIKVATGLGPKPQEDPNDSPAYVTSTDEDEDEKDSRVVERERDRDEKKAKSKRTRISDYFTPVPKGMRRPVPQKRKAEDNIDPKASKGAKKGPGNDEMLDDDDQRQVSQARNNAEEDDDDDENELNGKVIEGKDIDEVEEDEEDKSYAMPRTLDKIIEKTFELMSVSEIKWLLPPELTLFRKIEALEPQILDLVWTLLTEAPPAGAERNKFIDAHYARFKPQNKIQWDDPDLLRTAVNEAFDNREADPKCWQWAFSKKRPFPSNWESKIQKIFIALNPKAKAPYTLERMKRALENNTAASKAFCERLYFELMNKKVTSEMKTFSFDPSLLNLPHEQFREKFKELNPVIVDRSTVGDKKDKCALPAIDSPCDTGKASTAANLMAQQQFLSQYLTVQNPFKGMYVFHTAGSGKTCALIAAASNSFTTEKWNVLWVTRVHLKGDVWKNVYDTVCHQVFITLMQRKGIKIPKDKKKREELRKVYAPNFLDVISYEAFANFMDADWPRAFTNPAKGKKRGEGEEEDMLTEEPNEEEEEEEEEDNKKTEPKGKKNNSTTLFRQMVHLQKNQDPRPPKLPDGTYDMLYKTFIIIDEAHRMFSPPDSDEKLPPQEKVTPAQLKRIKERIHESYRVSKQNSCKVVLMSATPFCNSMIPFFKQLNVIIDPERFSAQFPESEERFRNSWYDPVNDEIFPHKKLEFLKKTKGILSYLDNRHDKTTFPVVHTVVYQLIKMSMDQTKALQKQMANLSKNKKESAIIPTIQLAENFNLKGKTKWPNYYNVANDSFDPDELRDDLEQNKLSPKFMALLDTIEQIDERDRRDYKHVFKHAVFVSTQSQADWALVVGSCFAAFGWIWVQNKDFSLNQDVLARQSTKKFCVLGKFGDSKNIEVAKSNILGQMKTWCQLSAPERAILKKDIAKGKPPKEGIFNSVYQNLHGELCRLIIFNEKFTEGVDIFDVRYIHVFNPVLSTCLMTQAVGRIQRFCGMTGLPYVPAKGYRINVYVYIGRLAKEIKDRYGDPTRDTYLLAQSFATNVESISVINTFLNMIYQNAVDRDWLQHLNPSHPRIQVQAKQYFKRVRDGSQVLAAGGRLTTDPYADARVSLWQRKTRFNEDPVPYNEQVAEELAEEKEAAKERKRAATKAKAKAKPKPAARKAPKPEEEEDDDDGSDYEDDDEEVGSKFQSLTIRKPQPVTVPELPDDSLMRVNRKALEVGLTPAEVIADGNIPTQFQSPDDIKKFEERFESVVAQKKKMDDLDEMSYDALDSESKQAIHNIGATRDEVDRTIEKHELNVRSLSGLNKLFSYLVKPWTG